MYQIFLVFLGYLSNFLLVNLNFDNLNLFVFFKHLRIKSLMVGGFSHPITQFLNLLLFLRELHARSSNRANMASTLMRTCCCQVSLIAVEFCGIKNCFTNSPFAYFMILNTFCNLSSIHSENLIFQHFFISFIYEM